MIKDRPLSDRLPPAVPFTEDSGKRQIGTRDELIDDLLNLVTANPDSIITRNRYRVDGNFAESAWTGMFGTFSEFKKQAGVVRSRHVQRLEKDVAKHASTGNYRAMNQQKLGYKGKYLKPGNGRFQTHVIITDVHDKECDPFTARVFMDTLKRIQPESVIIGGDLFDLPEFGKYGVDPREWDVVGRIAAAQQFLGQIRDAAPNAQVDMIEGNHEFRLLRHLAEASPAMRAVLSDLHGWTVPKLFGIDKYEVNYHARADLATFTQKDIGKELRRNYLIVQDAFMVHHFPEGRDMGYPGMHGHHHKHIVWPGYSVHFGAHEWHQLGAGHKRQASYCAGEKWTNGFMIAHVDTHTKHTVFEYIDVRDHAVVGGKWFERESAEKI